MAGLDNISDTPQPEQNEPTARVATKAVAPKSKYALPTPTASYGVDTSILNEMQKIIAQKEAKQNSFAESMKDVLAYDVGYGGDLNKSLRERAAERESTTADIFNMRSQIAQYRAAQKAAQENKDLFFGVQQPTTTPTAPLSGEATAPTTAGQTPTAAGQATTPTNTAAANAASGGLLNLVQDPGLRNQIAAQYFIDPAKAMTQLNTYLSKRAEEPAIKKEIDFLVANGLPREKALPIAIAKVAGSGSFVPHDIRTPAGTQQTTPLGAASELAKPTPPTVAGAPKAAPSAPAAAPSAAAPSATTAAAPAAPSAPAAAPSAADVAQEPTGFAPGSAEDLEIKKQREQAKIESAKSEQRKTGEDIALQRAATVEAGGNAQERLASIDYITGLTNSNPRAFGVLQRPGVMAAILTAAENGVNAGQLGAIGLKDLDEAIRKVGGTQADIDAAQKAAREFALMQLNAAKIYLKGQGAVSDAERALIRQLAGSTKNSPAAIRDFLAWNKIRADFDYKNGQAYSAFNQKYPNVSFEQYKQTPEYKALKAEYENNIRVFGRSTQPAKAAEHPGKSLLDKYPTRKQ